MNLSTASLWIATSALFSFGCAPQAEPIAETAPPAPEPVRTVIDAAAQQALTPEQVLTDLKAGNQRFVEFSHREGRGIEQSLGVSLPLTEAGKVNSRAEVIAIAAQQDAGHVVVAGGRQKQVAQGRPHGAVYGVLLLRAVEADHQHPVTIFREDIISHQIALSRER